MRQQYLEILGGHWGEMTRFSSQVGGGSKTGLSDITPSSSAPLVQEDLATYFLNTVLHSAFFSKKIFIYLFRPC